MSANVSRLQGARPKGVARRANKYVAGGIVYPGDFVIMNSSGLMVVATPGVALSGVAASYASASGQDLMVYDHPDQEFIVQASGATAPTAQADILNNFNVITTAGNSSYRVSRMALDAASKNTSATLPLKLLSYDNRPDNALNASGNVDCVVIINNHQLKGGTGTAGV